MFSRSVPSPIVDGLRTKFGRISLNKVQPDLQRTLCHGWLLDYVVEMDTLTYGRWAYWLECVQVGALPERGIPRIDFQSAPDPGVRAMLSACLDAIPQHGGGGWQGWSSWSYVRYFLEWLLFGFGHPGQPELP